MEDEASLWTSSYNKIKSNHDAAYDVLQSAFILEEQERSEEALQKYKESIQLIDCVLSVQVTCPQNPDRTWETATTMIQTMEKTRDEVLSRITSIQISNNKEQREQPLCYKEGTLQTYNELASALFNMTVDSVETKSTMKTNVVYMYENVKIYFISPKGDVTSTLTPQTLKIILIESEGENVPKAIMQVGDWVYPLIPGVSPYYRSDYGAFMLPNIYEETEGSSVAIILPQDADSEACDLLETVLNGILGESKHEKLPSQPLSAKISNGIVTGASFVSRYLVLGAGKIENLMNQNTRELLNHMKTAEQPTKIPDAVAKGAHMVETATNKGVQVTGFAAKQIGVATVKLGHFLAPHIKKQGTRFLTTGLNMSEENASAKINGVMTVASGAVKGFATVFHGLEHSASILNTSLRENTVKVVHHKYGEPAGELVNDTLSTMGNVLHINHNAKIFRTEHLPQRSVEEAGKIMISENEKASTSTDITHLPPSKENSTKQNDKKNK